MLVRRSSHAIFPIPFRDPDIPSKDAVGSKAHNLMRMSRCGLPVPPGFVISTDLCRAYLSDAASALEGLDEALEHALASLAEPGGRRFGDRRRPLLLSVRSGAAISMPGMMETILNIGLNRESLAGLVSMTGNPRLAQDCRRRLIQQFGEVVHHIPPARFEAKLAEVLADSHAVNIAELGTMDLKQLVAAFEAVFRTETGAAIPDDPRRQLREAIEAVLASWSSERARSYRALNHIPEDLGTAVTVQTMVFGNTGPDSGAGVGFTRSPASGEDALYVDFVANAQGEDVVAGRHRAAGLDELRRRAPAAYADLIKAKGELEHEFKDMQDFEFTVEHGRLLLLQARSGKRTPIAALRIAIDLVGGGLITTDEALATLDGLDLDAIEETRLQPPPGAAPLATGTSASVGVAVGAACFDPNRIESVKRSHGDVILVRHAAETEDIAALASASALLTVAGARTSHAAVVARQLGKPCIVGCTSVSIDPSGRFATVGGLRLDEGAFLSLDAAEGRIFQGQCGIVREKPAALITEIRRWSSPKCERKRVRRKRS